MNNQTTVERSAGRFFVGLARVLVALSFLALFGAWVTQATGGQIFGMTQQHLFSDAIVLALLGIGCFIDAWWHARRL
jgi:Na+-transporting methylmalonyl-CoA/oxaloacetate decarboxylase gamma subunit